MIAKKWAWWRDYEKNGRDGVIDRKSRRDGVISVNEVVAWLSKKLRREGVIGQKLWREGVIAISTGGASSGKRLKTHLEYVL